MSYLYQKQFIAVLIDFYLGSKSPLIGFSDKKHAIGGRYTEPELNSLIQTIGRMVQRANANLKSGNVPPVPLPYQGYKTYSLSDNDWTCIQCVDFYEKAMKDKYDYQGLGVIIQHFCFENETLSYSLARAILFGINRSNYDDIQPYLEAMSYFLTINDFLQTSRLEWVLGFPQPILTTGVFGSDSFGLYGSYSLDSQVISYDTPINLSNYSSVINFMLSNRKRIENLSMACLHQILILAQYDGIFNYLLSLPAPSYNYAKFTDWISPFIDYFLEECRKYYSSEAKEQLGLHAKKLYEGLEIKINEKLKIHEKELQQALSRQDAETTDQNNENNPEVETNEALIIEKEKDNVLKGCFPSYIIGKTYKVEEIDNTFHSKIHEIFDLSIRTNEIYCYITDSKPTGDHNLAFPSHLIEENSLRNYEVKTDSPISLFIQPRGVHPNIGADKNIQNSLQNEIEAALAQANDSTQSNTSDSPDQKQR